MGKPLNDLTRAERLQHAIDHLKRLRPTPLAEVIATDIIGLFIEQMGESYANGFRDGETARKRKIKVRS